MTVTALPHPDLRLSSITTSVKTWRTITHRRMARLLHPTVVEVAGTRGTTAAAVVVVVVVVVVAGNLQRDRGFLVIMPSGEFHPRPRALRFDSIWPGRSGLVVGNE